MTKDLHDIALSFIVFIILMILVQSCSNGEVTSVGNVEGIVTNAATELPVKDVTVRIGNTYDTTSSEGVFTLSNIKVGERTILASGEDFQTFSGNVDVQKDSTVTLNIQITPGSDDNNLPIADAGADQEVFPEELVTLDGSGSYDPDNDSLSFHWTFSALPDGSQAQLINPDHEHPEFTPDIKGEYKISLVVSDGQSSSIADEISLTALNRAPVANAGRSTTAYVSLPVILSGSESHDPDEDPITYFWEIIQKPTESSASLAYALSIEPELTPDVFGRYVISLTVNDGYENSSLSIITITASPESTSTIPDTGQNICYDESGASIQYPDEGEEYYGQDATYQYANSPSYTKLDVMGNDLADSAGTWAMVRDNVTGLVWEVKTDDGGIHDRDNAYNFYSPQNEFIAPLNADSFGGYNDWRLPTLKELSEIVHYGTNSPAVDMDYFVNTQSSYYRSSSLYASNPSSQAWLVGFGEGDFTTSLIYPSYSVRAVRGGIVSGDFTDNGDGTVTDNTTNLMWMQATSQTTMTWKAALAYCENLTLAGYSDWRLPNINELRSIVDYSNWDPAINTTYFPDTQPSDYCSSTTSASNPDEAWHIYFFNGNHRSSSKLAEQYIRAVRGGQ